jgi:hypothetical protein
MNMDINSEAVAYERPTVIDYGSLTCLTAGSPDTNKTDVVGGTDCNGNDYDPVS